MPNKWWRLSPGLLTPWSALITTMLAEKSNYSKYLSAFTFLRKHKQANKQTKVRARKQAGIKGLATPANAHNWYFSVLILHMKWTVSFRVKPKGFPIIKKHRFTQWILLTRGTNTSHTWKVHLSEFLPASHQVSWHWQPTTLPPSATWPHWGPCRRVWSSPEHSFTCFSGDRPDTAM